MVGSGSRQLWLIVKENILRLCRSICGEALLTGRVAEIIKAMRPYGGATPDGYLHIV
jgi:hypothetical protein